MTFLQVLWKKLFPLSAPQKEVLSSAEESKVHDLAKIYHSVNQEYFAGSLSLTICWYGRKKSARRKGRKVLGYYDQRKECIKIHRTLDDPFFPPYYLAYVVYHEMLHHVEPPIQGRRKRKVHHHGFTSREKQFKEFSLAKDFEKQNIVKIVNR